MMQHKLLGVPLVLWGAAALAVGLTWVFVWPSGKVAANHGLRYAIVRWGHAATWLLLAAAAFLAGIRGPASYGLAQWIARAALLVYAAFVAATMTAP